MEKLLLPHFSWYFFLLTVLLLVLIYLFLTFAKQQVMQLPISRKIRERLFSFFRHFLLLYELIFGVIGGSVFLLLNPIWHGILILFLVTVGFPLIRNYVIGKFLCFDYEFQTGKTIIAKKVQGVISKMNGLGIYVMTNDGMQYFNYTFLQTEGFSLLADDDMNEYCYLNINKTENSKPKLSSQLLLYKLMAVPYLDSAYKPTLIETTEPSNIQIRVLIRKGNHRKELVDLINNWGYDCHLTH